MPDRWQRGRPTISIPAAPKLLLLALLLWLAQVLTTTVSAIAIPSLATLVCVAAVFSGPAHAELQSEEEKTSLNSRLTRWRNLKKKQNLTISSPHLSGECKAIDPAICVRGCSKYSMRPLEECQKGLVMHYSGKLGNQMLQYIHARILVFNHPGLCLIEDSEQLESYKYLPDFAEARHHSDRKGLEDRGISQIVHHEHTPGGRHKQEYRFFRMYREMARCIFTKFSPLDTESAPSELKVLIHFRDIDHELRVMKVMRDSDVDAAEKILAQPHGTPAQFFAEVIDRIISSEQAIHEVIVISDRPGSTLVMALVDRVVNLLKLECKVVHNLPFQDHLMATSHRGHFVASMGTFSWTILFLGQYKLAHVPYYSSLSQGCRWMPWSDLFIDDDIRILYYDLSESVLSAETSQEVLQRDSIFAEKVLARDQR